MGLFKSNRSEVARSDQKPFRNRHLLIKGFPGRETYYRAGMKAVTNQGEANPGSFLAYSRRNPSHFRQLDGKSLIWILQFTVTSSDTRA